MEDWPKEFNVVPQFPYAEEFVSRLRLLKVNERFNDAYGTQDVHTARQVRFDTIVCIFYYNPADIGKKR